MRASRFRYRYFLTPALWPCFWIGLGAQINVDSLVPLLSTEIADSHRIDILIDLASHYKTRDTTQARSYAEEAITWSGKVGRDNDLARAYHQLGNLEQNLARYSRSSRFFRQALETARDSTDVAKIIGALGANQFYQGDLDSAEYYLSRSFKIKERQAGADTTSLGVALFNLANVARSRNDMTSALSYLFKARDYFEVTDAKHYMPAVYNAIGVIYGELNHDSDKIKYLIRAFEASKDQENNRVLAMSATNLANYYRLEEKYEEAEKYYLQSIPALREMGVRVNLAEALQNYGELKMELRQYGRAKELLVEATDIATEINSGASYVHAAKGLLDVYEHEGDMRRAQKVADQILAEIETLEDLEARQIAMQRVSEFYQANGNPARALELYQSYHILKDSLDEGRRNEIVQELQIQYETSEKEARLLSQEFTISRQETTRKLLLMGLGLLALSSILLITRFRLRQKITSQDLSLQIEKNQNLQQKQKLLAIDYMVQGQEEERKRIAKDLHDGLGSLLLSAKMQLSNIHQGIKALENLELFTKAEGLISNAHEEVRRIAHNMMPEALMNFGLKEAVQDFGHQINTSSEVQVVTNFYCETAELSEEVEIHLFRIIQEGINNALKHADADLITIQFSQDEEYYLLEISDDGKGFDLEEGKGKEGIGLRNLESRVKYLNGELTIASEIGKGTSLEIVVTA